jgi:hypothetical protein
MRTYAYEDPDWGQDTEKAVVPQRERRKHNIAYTFVVLAMRYEEALKIRPESAIAALEIEVENFEHKGVWYGEHLENLAPAQRKTR